MMLEGFPKVVTKTKIERGFYRLFREDGYIVDAKKTTKPGVWRYDGVSKRQSLRSFMYDMRHGYTTKDQWDVRYGDVNT